MSLRIDKAVISSAFVMSSSKLIELNIIAKYVLMLKSYIEALKPALVSLIPDFLT